MKQEEDPSECLFNITLEILVRAVRQEKEIKGIQIGKEKIKLPLLIDGMILYRENLKEQLLEQISSTNCRIYKISIQKSVDCYTPAMKNLKIKLRKYSVNNIVKMNKMLKNKFNKRSARLLHWILQNIVKEELNKWKDIPYSCNRRQNC